MSTSKRIEELAALVDTLDTLANVSATIGAFAPKPVDGPELNDWMEEKLSLYFLRRNLEKKIHAYLEAVNL